MKLVISGVGRSGTTLLFQQLSQLMRLELGPTQFVYEPYLWDISAAITKGQPFDNSQISKLGVTTHTHAPLFLQGADPYHDIFLNDIFSRTEDGENLLIKVIRGAGRLESYLAHDPDAKIICCVRNPLDVINSSFGLFSMYGDEFHASDWPRMLEAEAAQAGIEPEVLEETLSEARKAHVWWKHFTYHMQELCERFPERLHLFDYDAFSIDSKTEVQRMLDWLGFGTLERFNIGLSRAAGVRTSTRYLTSSDVNELLPSLDHYFETVTAPKVGASRTAYKREKLLQKYATAPFAYPKANHPLSKMTNMRLRDEILKSQSDRTSTFIDESMKEINASGQTLLKEISDQTRTLLEETKRVFSVNRLPEATVGCVVPCYNAENTIVKTVMSLLEQTRPYDQIVLVNDASHDRTAKILERFADRYSSIRVLNMEQNIGVSCARHLGFINLETDYITQIDSDDIAFPSKNRMEMDVLADDAADVAFSDVFLMTPNGNRLVDSSAYSGSGTEVLEALMRRDIGIPRDMTFARDLYFQAGGYNLNRNLYEDWDFKIRLAAISHRGWRKSESPAGTVYDRQSPGLSNATEVKNARVLTSVFLGALKHLDTSMLEDRAELASWLHAALGPFGRGYHGNLEAFLHSAPVDSLLALSRKMDTREGFAETDSEFADRIRAISTNAGGKSEMNATSGWSETKDNNDTAATFSVELREPASVVVAADAPDGAKPLLLKSFSDVTAPESEIRPSWYFSRGNSGTQAYFPLPGILPAGRHHFRMSRKAGNDGECVSSRPTEFAHVTQIPVPTEGPQTIRIEPEKHSDALCHFGFRVETGTLGITTENSAFLGLTFTRKPHALKIDCKPIHSSNPLKTLYLGLNHEDQGKTLTFNGSEPTTIELPVTGPWLENGVNLLQFRTSDYVMGYQKIVQKPALKLLAIEAIFTDE